MSKLSVSLLFAVFIFTNSSLAGSIIVDGQLTEALWQQAKQFDQFYVTQPLTLTEPKQKTIAKFYTDDDGVYIAFINEQLNLADVSQLTLHDENIRDDFNEVIIDFNGKGIRAYGFKVSRANASQDSIWTNESEESTDWNGEWFHATQTLDTKWHAEIFIPWSSLSMDVAQTETRKINLYFSRWQQGLTQRVAFPAIDSSQTQFLDKFAELEVDSNEYSSLDVFPYLSMNRDMLSHQNDNEYGVDLFWRPSSDKQLALSLNPDFGQVESDEIVVNFSAIETFLEEKRPFFVENHAMFDLRGPENLILVNTRRIGGPANLTVNQATDIDFAARYTQFSDVFEYGILVAAENDVDKIKGRDFISARLSYLDDAYNIGLLYNHTKTPQAQRTSDVWALDFSYEVSDKLQLTGLYFYSEVTVNSPTIAIPNIDDQGWTLTADFQAYDVWSQHLTFYQYGKDVDITDFGFVERVNIKKVSYDSVYEWPSGYSGWGISDYAFEFGIDFSTNEQNQDLPITSEAVFIINTLENEEWEFELLYQNKGIDDLITLGHNPVEIPAAHEVKISFKTDQSKRLRFDLSAAVGESGLKSRWQEYEFEPSYQLNEFISLGLEFAYIRRDSWLISLYEQSENDEDALLSLDADEFEGEEFDEAEFDDENNPNMLNDYQQEELSLGFNLSARFAEKHEIRLKIEGVAVKAKGIDFFEAEVNGNLIRLNETPENFSESEFFAQIRYRYEMSPLSAIYAVYGRGTESEFDDINQSSTHLIKSAINHTTEENIFVKARFHF